MSNLGPRGKRAQILKKHNELKKVENEKPKEGIRVINGKYQIDKKIGEGVSSIVYSGFNIHNGEKVAIKKIKNFLQNKY